MSAVPAGTVPWVMMDEPIRGRSCGSCKACCTQVPVDLPSGHKEANVRCEHLCSKGCGIYQKRPTPCRYWSCRWLFDPDTAALRRPDRSGYVIDAMPDTIIANGRPMDVVQVWCDPHRRDAHRDPALREFIALMGEKHFMGTIIRWSSGEAMVVVPPALTGGEWFEQSSTCEAKADMKARLDAVGYQRPRMLANLR